MATHSPVLGSQRSHAPVQASWQQTPSVQLDPTWHCWLSWHGSPSAKRHSAPTCSCPGWQTQLPLSAHTLPSAAQSREQQRACPVVSCWQTLGVAHWPASHGKPSVGKSLQPLPGVQPFGHSVLAMAPALQRRSALPSHVTVSPSQATQLPPSLLQNRPAPQAVAQQMVAPCPFSTQTPDWHCSALAHAAPARSEHAPVSESHEHSASGRSAVKVQSRPV
jgi:hypothetical protein